MSGENLKERTKNFSLRVINLVDSLPQNTKSFVIGKQLLRSATSVGANYRAVCRGRSKAEFISKLSIVIEESDESCFWLEIIIESKILKKELVEPLLIEANEIVAIMVASRKSAIKNS